MATLSWSGPIVMISFLGEIVRHGFSFRREKDWGLILDQYRGLKSIRFLRRPHADIRYLGREWKHECLNDHRSHVLRLH